MKKENTRSMDEMMTILNKKSGVLGPSGVSSDFRDLDNAAAEGNARAALAVEVFEYGVRTTIAEYAAAMGGVDAVIFTAGVEGFRRYRSPRSMGIERTTTSH